MEKQLRTQNIKLVPIGNSRGVRIPKTIIQKYNFDSILVLEETEEGILLRRKDENKLSWEDTYKTMADENENWNDFDVTLLDGLEEDEVDSKKV